MKRKTGLSLAFSMILAGAAAFSPSLAFAQGGFTLRYDQNPAPLPIPSLAPAGSTFSKVDFAATNGVPFAARLDTLTEATLIYTFL